MLQSKRAIREEFFGSQNNPITDKGTKKMSKADRAHMEEYLEQMLKDKPVDEPAEKTLATFCQRYGVSMAQCSEYYDRLIKLGRVKEK